MEGAPKMAIEGIWTGEVYGAFGWENRGVFIFENQRVIGGDNRQYTTGTYVLSGKTFTANLSVHYYGPPRTVYGETLETFDTVMSGELQDGTIEGTIGRPDRPQFDLQLRLTRRMGFPD